MNQLVLLQTSILQPALDSTLDPRALYRDTPNLFFADDFISEDIAGLYQEQLRWSYIDISEPFTSQQLIAQGDDVVFEETKTLHAQIAKKVFDLRRGDDGLFPVDGGYSLFFVRGVNGLVSSLRLYFLPEHAEWYGYRTVVDDNEEHMPWPVGTRVFLPA